MNVLKAFMRQANKKAVLFFLCFYSIAVFSVNADVVNSEGFEAGMGDWGATTKGNVQHAVLTQYAHSGNHSFKMGPSSCGMNCFDRYAVSLTRQFDTQIHVTSLTAWVYEQGHWGGKGYLIVDGAAISTPNLSNRSNDQ